MNETIELNDLVYIKINGRAIYGQVVALNEFDFVIEVNYACGTYESYFVSFETDQYIKAGKFVVKKTKKHWWSKTKETWEPEFDHQKGMFSE
jgi:hypothetical protein